MARIGRTLVYAALTIVVLSVSDPATAILDPGVRCAAQKTKAVGKAAVGILRCQQTALRLGEKVDAACLQAVGDKLAASFERYEADASCATVGDVTLVAPWLTQLAGIVDVLLVPIVPTTQACGNTAAPECEGACPAGQLCVPDGDNDRCRCITTACGQIAGAQACYGECPPATPICSFTGGVCQCTAGPTPCIDAGSPACDGACAPGEVCLPGEYGPGGEVGPSCFCRPVGCGDLFGSPYCGGECPTEAPYCRDVGGTCVCAPSLG